MLTRHRRATRRAPSEVTSYRTHSAPRTRYKTALPMMMSFGRQEERTPTRVVQVRRRTRSLRDNQAPRPPNRRRTHHKRSRRRTYKVKTAARPMRSAAPHRPELAMGRLAEVARTARAAEMKEAHPQEGLPARGESPQVAQRRPSRPTQTRGLPLSRRCRSRLHLRSMRMASARRWFQGRSRAWRPRSTRRRQPNAPGWSAPCHRAAPG